ncbi:MAG: hypothetical protein EA423_04405 [Phycisphaerales bacterium]|nr:MAG: hypothetical protein EA423_04405 [Phycisphaerales bacterium]
MHNPLSRSRPDDFEAWSGRFLSLAEGPFSLPLGGESGLVAGYRDDPSPLAERFRRPMRFALPLARWICTEPGPFRKSPSAPVPPTMPSWWVALLDAAPLPQLTPEGPLLPEDPEEAIEVWSEHELAALHAAWWIARSNNDLRNRIDAAVRWHTENLQPDNATNHPWAVHVFAEFALRTGDADARLHADTICSNYQVLQSQAARPIAEEPEDRADLFSALIMLDASRAMRSAAR